MDTGKARTRVVADNGFNPVWQETFTFRLQRPEVAILYMAVHDAVDVARTAFLAYFAVPLTAVRIGYRSCPLRSALGKKFPLCSLLVRFERMPTAGAPTPGAVPVAVAVGTTRAGAAVGASSTVIVV